MEQSTVEELRHIFQVLLQSGLPVPLALMSISCWSTSASLPVQVLQKSMGFFKKVWDYSEIQIEACK